MSGMRLSVYCSDKMAFADPAIIQQQVSTMPWLGGFHVNDVYGSLCDHWRVEPIDATTKKPFYSNVPVLLGSGGMDAACRPLYNDLIHHYCYDAVKRGRLDSLWTRARNLRQRGDWQHRPKGAATGKPDSRDRDRPKSFDRLRRFAQRATARTNYAQTALPAQRHDDRVARVRLRVRAY